MTVNAGSRLDRSSQPHKTTELLLCEQSTGHQGALLSAAMETNNAFLAVVAASYQVCCCQYSSVSVSLDCTFLPFTFT